MAPPNRAAYPTCAQAIRSVATNAPNTPPTAVTDPLRVAASSPSTHFRSLCPISRPRVGRIGRQIRGQGLDVVLVRLARLHDGLQLSDVQHEPFLLHPERVQGLRMRVL